MPPRASPPPSLTPPSPRLFPQVYLFLLMFGTLLFAVPPLVKCGAPRPARPAPSLSLRPSRRVRGLTRDFVPFKTSQCTSSRRCERTRSTGTAWRTRTRTRYVDDPPSTRAPAPTHTLFSSREASGRQHFLDGRRSRSRARPHSRTNPLRTSPPPPLAAVGLPGPVRRLEKRARPFGRGRAGQAEEAKRAAVSAETVFAFASPSQDAGPAARGVVRVRCSSLCNNGTRVRTFCSRRGVRPGGVPQRTRRAPVPA